MRAAAVQLNSNENKERNLASADELTRAAAADGAELVVLPEKFNVLGTHEDYASARIHFESGCSAEVTASRASPTQERRMQVWGPEGHAEVDFYQRKVTLVQPTSHHRPIPSL